MISLHDLKIVIYIFKSVCIYVAYFKGSWELLFGMVYKMNHCNICHFFRNVINSKRILNIRYFNRNIYILNKINKIKKRNFVQNII